MKCEFCGGDIPYDTSQCPACGAPCKIIHAPRTSSEEENDDSDSVKNYSSVDVSFLKDSSKSEDDDILEELMEQNDDSDYRTAKFGCVLGIIVVAIAAVAIYCNFFK